MHPISLDDFDKTPPAFTVKSRHNQTKKFEQGWNTSIEKVKLNSLRKSNADAKIRRYNLKNGSTGVHASWHAL